MLFIKSLILKAVREEYGSRSILFFMPPEGAYLFLNFYSSGCSANQEKRGLSVKLLEKVCI